MNKPTVLAVGGSLRGTIRCDDVECLIKSIYTIKSEAELHLFIQRCSFCNSEIGMVVSLWAASQAGCNVDYLPLLDSNAMNLLKQKILKIDGLLLCGPVYFGDRSSLISDFIDVLQRDKDLIISIFGKPFACVVAGAKRNGGQETTIIYQFSDMLSLGMVGVGNDADTTSQYGGTIVAGNVGAAASDEYGLSMSIGTGRRLGKIAYMLSNACGVELKKKLRVSFWILQDSNGYALKKVQDLIKLTGGAIESHVINFVDQNIERCIACNICPPPKGGTQEYRCDIKHENDPIRLEHRNFTNCDLIVPVTLTMKNISIVTSVYQRFLERTRYLRRGDYVLTDIAILPLIFEELGASQNMALRIPTSMIRQHTIILKPIIGYLHDNILLNDEDMNTAWRSRVKQATKIAGGRLALPIDNRIRYNPIGYMLPPEDGQKGV